MMMYEARDIDLNTRFRFRNIDTLLRRYGATHYSVAHRFGERTIITLLRGRPGYSSVEGTVNIPNDALVERGAVIRCMDPGYSSTHSYAWLGLDGNWFADPARARKDLTMQDLLELPNELREYAMFQPNGPYRP